MPSSSHESSSELPESYLLNPFKQLVHDNEILRIRGLPMAQIAINGPVDDSDWQDSALCRYTDPDKFFPGKNGSSRAAKILCEKCDVRSECLQTSLDNEEWFGVWGGLSEQERRQLLGRRKRFEA